MRVDIQAMAKGVEWLKELPDTGFRCRHCGMMIWWNWPHWSHSYEPPNGRYFNHEAEA